LAFSFCILGPLEVREEGRELPLGTGRQRALLALLLVNANELVPADRVIEELWSGRPPPSARKALQGYVSQLRRALGAETILTRGPGYVLVATGTDGGEFERLTKLAAEQDAPEAVVTLERALALWRGRAFEEFEYEDWAQLEIGRLEELRLSAIEQKIEAELELGHHAQLVPELETLVADHPLREQLRGQLMVALYRSGRHADGLDVYRRGRQVLRDELGLEPSPFLAKLERQILSHDPTLTTPTHRFRPVDTAEKAREPRSPRRRWLVAGVVAAALVGVVAAVIVITGRGGSAPELLPNSVIRIDPKTMKATQVAQVGDAPDLIIDSGGYLWITNDILRGTTGPPSNAIRNAGDHTLVRVDPSTGKAVVVGGGLAPCGLTADPSGDVWVANCYPSTPGLRDDVIRVDARTLAFKQTLPAPGGDSYYRGVAYGGGSLWLSQVGGGTTVVEIDPETGTNKTLPLKRSTGALAWSAGYGDLWITNFDEGSMMRLHAAPRSLHPVDGVAVNPGSVVVDGNVVWVGDWSAPQLARLSAVGHPRVRRIRLGSAGVWNIAVGAGAVWAASPDDDALWRIDPKTNAVTRVNLFPLHPTGVTADANNVWVAVRGK
jgi:DNA-binding SARP family transcriptional activator/streptogramin lyase